jgi:hypothetical protein
MLYGAPEVPRQEREPLQRVIHSPLTGLRGGASERSSLVSLPWMKNFRKINKIKKFKNRRKMKMKMKGWGGGTCETKLNAYTMI